MLAPRLCRHKLEVINDRLRETGPAPLDGGGPSHPAVSCLRLFDDRDRTRCVDPAHGMSAGETETLTPPGPLPSFGWRSQVTDDLAAAFDYCITEANFIRVIGGRAKGIARRTRPVTVDDN